MSKVRGVDHFSEFFKDFSDEYVIIGGTAASEILNDNELTFRATKDVDMVILTNDSPALNSRIIEYVKLGQFKAQETVEGKRYYRFSDPADDKFPKLLEIFARNESGLELETGQHIIPIINQEADRLSAILLDDDYFELIRANAVKSKEGYSLIDPRVNICLKARAYRELTQRKVNGEKVDSREIEKHKKDVLRIALVLDGSKTVSLPQVVSDDLKQVLTELSAMDAKVVAQVLKGQPITTKEPLIKAIENEFEFFS